jgi:hypothetical protein
VFLQLDCPIPGILDDDGGGSTPGIDAAFDDIDNINDEFDAIYDQIDTTQYY